MLQFRSIRAIFRIDVFLSGIMLSTMIKDWR